MYLTVRQMTADAGRMEDAISFASSVAERLNADHGGNARVSINIGGDPSAIALASRWDTLGDYAAMRESMMGDRDLQSAIRLGSELFTGATDSIGRIIKPAGQPGPFATLSTANIQMPRVAEAIPFALEVAEFVEDFTGRGAGVVTSVTGDRSQLMWYGFDDSLDQIASSDEKLGMNEEYVGFFARSEDLFVSGSLIQSIWQHVS